MNDVIPCADSSRVLAAGTNPERPWMQTRLLSVHHGQKRIRHGRVVHLPALFESGDVLVLNDAATLPASLPATVVGSGSPLEVRLAGSDSRRSFSPFWRVVVMGAGDWREDTNRRTAPPVLRPGAALRFGEGLGATVVSESHVSGRLLRIRFDREGDTLARAIYALGQPVMYRHLESALDIQDVQTPYAARPWAVEMPSTGRPLAWRLLHELRTKGVHVAFLTHAAGLSATGEPALDAHLPFPERYEIPEQTTRLLVQARCRGRRVIAAGTTVVRALEASGGRAGFGIAMQKISPQTSLKVVDGILTGVHSPGESHWDLLGAFAGPELLLRAREAASCHGFLAHELGDLMWVSA